MVQFSTFPFFLFPSLSFSFFPFLFFGFVFPSFYTQLPEGVRFPFLLSSSFRRVLYSSFSKGGRNPKEKGMGISETLGIFLLVLID